MAGGEGRARWWRVIGIGCLSVFVIGGFVFGVGAYKMAGCLGELSSTIERSAESFTIARSFGAALAADDREAAAALLHPSFEGGPAALARALREDADLIVGATPVLEGLALNDHEIEGSSPERFELEAVIGFHQPEGGAEFARARVTLRPRDRRADPLAVSSLVIERAIVRPETQPPSLAVAQFDASIQEGAWERALLYAHPDFKVGGGEELRRVVERQGEILTRSRVAIDSIRYPQSDRAEVSATATTSDGSAREVVYEVRRIEDTGSWGVSALRVLAAPAAKSGAEPEAAAGSSGE